MQTIPCKLKFNTKIWKYPEMPSMVMSFKERNLQRRIWNCVKPYDRSFPKIEDIEISWISVSKGVNIFPNARLKILEF